MCFVGIKYYADIYIYKCRSLYKGRWNSTVDRRQFAVASPFSKLWHIHYKNITRKTIFRCRNYFKAYNITLTHRKMKMKINRT